MLRWPWLKLAVLATVLGMFGVPARSWAGQVVFSHNPGPYSTSSDLWVMNADGSDPRMLIPGGSQPNLRPATTDLAYQASGTLPGFTGAEACGFNCTGVYTLIGGKIRRVSPPITSCVSDPSNCSSQIDNDPTLTADGRVVYAHSGSYTGETCVYYDYYCGTYGGVSNVFFDQSDLGGDKPAQWPTPATANYQPAEFAAPFADPGNANLIAYSGLEDYNCTTPVDGCDPLTIDDSRAQSPYNVTDADCYFGSGGCYDSGDLYILGWSPGGAYLLVEFGSQSAQPGLWVFKNQAYTHAGSPSGPIVGTGWWVWDSAPASTPYGPGIGDGGALTSDTPGQGQIIFSYNGDIVSIPGSCWGGAPTTAMGSPTCSKGIELTGAGAEDDPTYTSSTATIAVNTSPSAKSARSTLGKVSHDGTTAAAMLKCSTGAGDRANVVAVATYETLHGSKVVAVAARATTHRTVIVGSKRITLAAGKSATVRVSLDGTGKKLLKRFHKLPLLLLVLQGNTTIATHRLTISEQRKR